MRGEIVGRVDSHAKTIVAPAVGSDVRVELRRAHRQRPIVALKLRPKHVAPLMRNPKRAVLTPNQPLPKIPRKPKINPK